MTVVGPGQNLAPVTKTDPLALFETSYLAFQQAERASGFCVEWSLRLGEGIIRLRFAGTALISLLTPAFEHLFADPAEEPSLTVCVWDDISTGVQMPAPPWNDFSPYTKRGDVRGYNDSRIRTSYNFTARALSMLDQKRRLALYWTKDARTLPGYESSAPLRTILHWWAATRDAQLVHAAAVGVKECGVLLADKGGSGKSTTALYCLRSGLSYLGDDYCMITLKPVPHAYCVYSSGKLSAEDLARIVLPASTISNRETMAKEKAVLFLQPFFSDRILAGFPVRAILLPEITGFQDTTCSPASPQEAFRALALSTMSQLAAAGQSSIEIMNHFVHQVPCFHLMLGTDLSQIPVAIRNLLASR